MQAGTFDCGACETALPPLLLLPGTLCDQRVFAPLLAHLELGSRKVLHGAFDNARSTTAAATALLDAHGSDLAVLGFSLGGIVALEMARIAPNRVAGLALLASTAAPVAEIHHTDRRAAVERARSAGPAAVIAELLPRYLARSESSNAHHAAILAMANDGGAESFANQTELALSREDLRQHLSTLHMPVLVIGGEHDQINPPATQRELARALPNVTLAIIPNSGHFSLLERPAEVALHVAAWLNQLNRFSTPSLQEKSNDGRKAG